ncbi:ATP-binding cassette sub- G member 1 [Entophlyctis luteolus]|nr:ATP-binding cassette sub- G member 1 [Entophlyctis luteolus]
MEPDQISDSKRVQIVFKSLTYSVMVKDTSGEQKHRFRKPKVAKKLLTFVSGIFQPGKMTAVMGASGAGKTSLLQVAWFYSLSEVDLATQVLAGEARQGTLTGAILANGVDIGGNMKKVSGFVFQDDCILATMTVREAITMSAILRLPAEMSAEDKTEAVNRTIKLLNLEKCAETIIGNSSIKGVSGGERKRTAMAMEMITNPSVIFLDEPTSGLDTFTAFSVINTLKNLAKVGRTVIMTIHQPSSEIFQLFDDLLLMANGEVVYAGQAEKATNYFAKYGYICPDFTNPADFLFMTVLNNEPDAEKSDISESSTTKKNNEERIRSLIQTWKKSEENSTFEAQLISPKSGGLEKSTFKTYASISTQFGFLFGRVWKNAMRNPLAVKAKAGQTVFIAIIIGLLFQGTGTDFAYSGAQNRNGMMFFSVINNVMSAAIANLSMFGEEKAVFSREFGAGYYGLPAYFLSKIVVELPFQIAFPIVFSLIVYWFVGLQNVAQNVKEAGNNSHFSSCSGFSLGIAVASMFESLEAALGAMPLILMPLMLFSGLFINNGSIPAYFDWIKYISPMKYGYEAMAKNEYTGLTIACRGGNNTAIDGSLCLDDLGFSDVFSIDLCIIILCAMVVDWWSLKGEPWSRKESKQLLDKST